MSDLSPRCRLATVKWTLCVQRKNLSVVHLKDFRLDARFLVNSVSRLIFASLYQDKEEGFFAFASFFPTLRVLFFASFRREEEGHT